METRHIDKKEFLTKVWDFENSPQTYPKEGTPTMVQGYMPEVTMENLIKDKLL